MSRDRRGMAVLLDALLFLMVLSTLSALLMMPGSAPSVFDHGDMARSFHSVMLSGEVPGEDDSALSRVSLGAFLVIVAQSPSGLSSRELQRIGSAVNGTLMELSGMGNNACWVLGINGEEHIFGRPFLNETISQFADRRVLSDDEMLYCILMIAA